MNISKKKKRRNQSYLNKKECRVAFASERLMAPEDSCRTNPPSEVAYFFAVADGRSSSIAELRGSVNVPTFGDLFHITETNTGWWFGCHFYFPIYWE